MARDYAQSGGERRHTARRKGDSSTLPGWVWLVAGLSIGLAVAAFTYIGRPVNHAPTAETSAEAGDDNLAGKKTATPQKKEQLQLPPEQKARFTFYELLPNQEEILPGDAVSPKTPTTAQATATSEIYFIQVASYRSAEDADNQKASLALLGAEARVEKVTIDNKDTYYRVRIGPEKNLARAQGLMQRLKENGIQGMLVKVKA